MTTVMHMPTLHLVSKTPRAVNVARRHLCGSSHLPGRRGVSVHIHNSFRSKVSLPASVVLPSLCRISSAQPQRHYSSTSICTPEVHSFYETKTSTWQYLVVDPATSEAVIIDTVLDYDHASGTISTETADGILSFIEEKGIKVRRILETHAHADHLTASRYYKSRLPGGNTPICIGKRITQVQDTFADSYGFEPHHFKDTFDVYLRDDEEFPVGELICRVMHLPGHTPDHVGYVIGNAVFTGDSIFMPDVGSARVDFPGGNAKDLYSSMQKLLTLPKYYRLFVGHDYPPADRTEEVCVATVGEQQESNKHGKLGTTEEKFIQFREARDAVLGAPRLLHPSLQVNIRAGKLPPLDTNGRKSMRIPLKGVSF